MALERPPHHYDRGPRRHAAGAGRHRRRHRPVSTARQRCPPNGRPARAARHRWRRIHPAPSAEDPAPALLGLGGLPRPGSGRGGGGPVEPRLLRARARQRPAGPAVHHRASGQGPSGHPPGAPDRRPHRPGHRADLSLLQAPGQLDPRATGVGHRWHPPVPADRPGRPRDVAGRGRRQGRRPDPAGLSGHRHPLRSGHLRHLSRDTGLRGPPGGRRGHRRRRSDHADGPCPHRHPRPLPLGADRRPDRADGRGRGRPPRCPSR